MESDEWDHIIRTEGSVKLKEKRDANAGEGTAGRAQSDDK